MIYQKYKYGNGPWTEVVTLPFPGSDGFEINSKQVVKVAMESKFRCEMQFYDNGELSVFQKLEGVKILSVHVVILYVLLLGVSVIPRIFYSRFHQQIVIQA